MTKDKADWIKIGYEDFALLGESGLKVERLSKKLDISKSSFYHHFSDMPLFMEHLLRHHLAQCEIMADKERAAQRIDPDLIDILVEHKIDLLFNRQLRVNQQNKVFQSVMLKSNQIIGTEFVILWAKDMQINLSRNQLEALFQLALENFYLQINAENLNYPWLSSYFKQLKGIAKHFT
jgi:AcrR family transcriptional regulator